MRGAAKMAAIHAVATERDPPGQGWGEASRRAADGDGTLPGAVACGRRWNAAPTGGPLGERALPICQLARFADAPAHTRFHIVQFTNDGYFGIILPFHHTVFLS